jgi:hypothetical protein
MAKTTRVPTPTDRPTARPGHCSWHQGHDRAVRLVRVTADQGSGSSAPDLYACAPCCHAYDLAPIEECR